MSLYPTVEDLKVDKEITAQVNLASAIVRESQAALPYSTGGGAMVVVGGTTLYPMDMLQSYMGLDVSENSVRSHAPACLQPVALTSLQPHGALQPVAPVTALSGGLTGMQRAEIKQGVRQVQLCRGRDGKFGFRMASINNGLFIGFVHKDSPASLVGIRFGDQILEINGKSQ
jgi:syntenin-1